jgi:hypothetical protein
MRRDTPEPPGILIAAQEIHIHVAGVVTANCDRGLHLEGGSAMFGTVASGSPLALA